MREYCGLDAQRCLSMGYLLGSDCADIDKEESDICIVDQLVLPLVSNHCVWGSHCTPASMDVGVAIIAPEIMVSGVQMDPSNHGFWGIKLHHKSHGLTWGMISTPIYHGF
jgi:hypothetical protein